MPFTAGAIPPIASAATRPSPAATDPTLNVESLRDLLDAHRGENVFYQTPIQYLPGIDGWRLHALRRMKVVLVIGREANLLDNNRHLSEILWNKGIWHALNEWEERAHRGRYRRQMARLYI
jgi:esterase/lipase superfamily enzyme